MKTELVRNPAKIKSLRLKLESNNLNGSHHRHCETSANRIINLKEKKCMPKINNLYKSNYLNRRDISSAHSHVKNTNSVVFPRINNKKSKTVKVSKPCI